MAKTLQDVKDTADARLAQGDLLGALKVYRLVLEGAPLDFELRLQIGDLLAGLKALPYAAEVYKSVAIHCIKAGNPFLALTAIKRIELFRGNVRALTDGLIETYTAGSPRIGRGVKQAPAEYSRKVRDDLDLDYPIETEVLIAAMAHLAANLADIQNYPSIVPAVPIFSSLKREGFAALLGRLELRQYGPGEAIIRQGDAGQSVFFLARGEVRVVRIVQDAVGAKSEVQLARLGQGSLFGEMALVSADPRSASVVCDTPVDALELTRESIETLAQSIPDVAEAMARFTRERMINNLLATNPLFAPFDEEGGKKLLARFTGHEVPAKTVFLEEGTAGNGLYVILQGQAEVLKWDPNAEEHVALATLGPGDVAGEISLVLEEPVSATVRTTTKSTLLFLARELFRPLVESVPDLLVHFNRLANQRLIDTESKLMRPTVIDPFTPEEKGFDRLDDDDLVFI